MFYVVKFRLTLARFGAQGMESSLQEAKQTPTHFWGRGRASKFQQTEEKNEKAAVKHSHYSNAEKIAQWSSMWRAAGATDTIHESLWNSQR